MNSNKPRNLNREKIREMYQEGYCSAAIAREFNCHVNAIMHHISDLVIPIHNTKNTKAKLTNKQVKQIRTKYIKNGLAAPILAEIYSVSQSTILNVIHGIYYRHVPGEVISKSGTVYVLPENYASGKATNTKGRLKGGPRPGTIRRQNGILKRLAKKHKVTTSTICKWLKNGKLKEPRRKNCKRKKSAK